MATEDGGVGSREEALVIAKRYLGTVAAPEALVIDESKTSEHAFGWVFAATTRRHLETGDFRYMIPGLGPIAVQRDGRVVQLPTSVTPASVIAEMVEAWGKRDA